MSDKQAGVMFWVVKDEDLYLDSIGGPQPPEVAWKVVRWSTYRDDATRYRDRDTALAASVRHGGHVVAVRDRQRPTYNHTRADGPFDPCQICLHRMRRSELIALVNDLRGGSHE